MIADAVNGVTDIMGLSDMAATSTASIKLDPEMKARIEQVASDKRRSSQSIIREAISRYVEREEQSAQFDRDTLAALEEFETTGLHVTNDEVNAWFDRLDAGERVPPPECHT